MQLELFSPGNRSPQRSSPIGLEELLAAYYNCRKNKRNTANALAFEMDCEAKLYDLWCQINDGSYQPGRSVAFVVRGAVVREVFAADFGDRVVHHLIISKLNPLFEKKFIYDSYVHNPAQSGSSSILVMQPVDPYLEGLNPPSHGNFSGRPATRNPGNRPVCYNP